MLAYVLNKNSEPLMPCKPAKARKLLAKISLSGISIEQMDDLSEAMDLESSEIHEIFIKAEKEINRV